MSDTALAVLGVSQMAGLVTVAPLLNGVIRKVKARLQSRHGPPLLQNYYDLAKWFARPEQLAGNVSLPHYLAPVGLMATALTASLFVPVFGHHTPLSSSGDLFVVVGLLALARGLLALAAMDSGGAFGQMGSSRELAIGALVEPVLLMSLVALAVAPGTSRLGEIVAFGDLHPGHFFGLGWGLAACAFGVVLIAETGRIPVDNPDTHLELTMVHEGMLIEYSGRSLGVLHLAHMLKQALLIVVFVNLFLPIGLAHGLGAGGYVAGTLIVASKVVVAAVGLAVVETLFAKMRLFQLPDLIGAAAFAAMLGLALTVLYQ